MTTRPVPSLARYWTVNLAAFGVGLVVTLLLVRLVTPGTLVAMALGGLLPLAAMIVAAFLQLRGTGG